MLRARNYLRGMLGVSALVCAMVVVNWNAPAHAQSRSLKLYYLHTGERATITYKRNGKFLTGGLKKMNHFLRDWRRNEPTRMDPNLLDLIWEVYRQSGSRKAIHVISAYRSPTTNNMLRKRGRGVAKKSQHTVGKAMDFFLPDVKLAKLRKIGLLKQAGGVGYYPRSGSPFVHMDTGRVRHWPRMNRKQLVRVFPNGKTLHVPTDGKPLPGYKQAVASYNARKSSTKKIPISKGSEKEQLNFFQRLARVGREDKEDDDPNIAPKPRAVKTTKTPATIASASTDTSKPEKLPEPEPSEPSIPALASIPVPLNAPRGAAPVESGVQETILAQLDEPADGNAPLDDNQPLDPTEYAPPIPARRPQFNGVLVAQNTTPVEPETNIAPVETATVQLASATAIKLRNDLRNQAQAQLRSAIGLAPPRPTAEIGSSFETALVAEPEPRLGNSSGQALTRAFVVNSGEGNLASIDEKLKTGGTTSIPEKLLPEYRGQAIIEAPVGEDPIIVASLQTASANLREPLDENLKNTGIAPAPTRNPEFLSKVASVKSDPIDSDLNNSGAIPSPQINPAPRLVASLNSENTIFYTSPIPVQRPVASGLTQIAGNSGNGNAEVTTIDSGIEKPVLVAAIPSVSPFGDSPTAALPLPSQQTSFQTAALPTDLKKVNLGAPSDLDNLLSDWQGHKTTGKYVLDTATTIKGIDDLRAPAYGRAAIRQAPRVVLTNGFTNSGNVQASGKFTGKAVQFLAFLKFK